MADNSALEKHPPKVPLTIRVGITGHRKLGLESSIALGASMITLLKEIREGASIAAAKVSFAYGKKVECRLVSALAEGADRLAAQAALDLGLEIDYILPFEREVYKGSFKGGAESLAEFDRFLPRALPALELDGGVDPERCEAFGDLAEALVANCDVLIAVWRGQPAKGVGGTRDVMGRAMERGIPTIWMDPAHPETPTLIKALQPVPVVELGELKDNLERRLVKELVFDSAEKVENENFLGRLFTWLGRSSSELEKAKDYFAETSRFLSAVDKEDCKDSWRSIWGRLSREASKVHEPITQTFLWPFTWVDRLANYYGRLYRSSFVLNYLLGATVVLLAFQGHIGTAKEPSEVWTWLELILILVILIVTVTGGVKRWHERWLDYRWLAEVLRQMHFLAPQAWRRPPFRAPAHIGTGQLGRSWLFIYSSGLLREAPLPLVKIDQGYLNYCRGAVIAFTASQIKYHEGRRTSQARTAERIHLTCLSFFLLALAGCILHLFHLNSQVTGPMVIVLPAFASALGAILHHGEYEQQAEHSAALVTWLQEAQTAWKGGSPRREPVGRNADALSEAIMDELVDWRDAFYDKPTPMGH